MAMKEICGLGKNSALSVLGRMDDKDIICLKEGVWNPYNEVSVMEAKRVVGNSDFGARICYNEEDSRYYVSCPYDVDMW